MYLVTGGAGFVGSHLVPVLLRKESVRVLDIQEKPEWMPKEVEYMQGSITDIEDCIKACKDVKIIHNLASVLVVSKVSKKKFWNTNVKGTKNLIEAAIMRKCEKFIHTSTDMVYGIMKKTPVSENDECEPVGPYGKSKLAAEKLCKAYLDRMKITVLRPGPIIGQGRGGLFWILFNWMSENKKIYTIGDGTNRFSMIDVRDLVEAYLLAEHHGDGELFNISSDSPPRTKDLIEQLAKHTKSESVIYPLPSRSAKFALGFLNTFKLAPLESEHYRIADTNHVLDNSKAKLILGWRPKYSNFEMLKLAYEWFLKNQDKEEAKEGFLKVVKWFS